MLAKVCANHIRWFNWLSNRLRSADRLAVVRWWTRRRRKPRKLLGCTTWSSPETDGRSPLDRSDGIHLSRGPPSRALVVTCRRGTYLTAVFPPESSLSHRTDQPVERGRTEAETPLFPPRRLKGRPVVVRTSEPSTRRDEPGCRLGTSSSDWKTDTATSACLLGTPSNTIRWTTCSTALTSAGVRRVCRCRSPVSVVAAAAARHLLLYFSHGWSLVIYVVKRYIFVRVRLLLALTPRHLLVHVVLFLVGQICSIMSCQNVPFCVESVNLYSYLCDRSY